MVLVAMTYHDGGVSKKVKQQLGHSAGGNQLIKEPGGTGRLRLTQTNPINYSTQHKVNWNSAKTTKYSLSVVPQFAPQIQNGRQSLS